MDTYTTLPRIDKDAPEEDVVVIHFLRDGLTAFGKVWYQGEELTIQRGTGWWDATKNRDGDSWVETTEEQQVEKWGEPRFRLGHWAGRGFDLDDDALDEADRELLRKVEAERVAKVKKDQAAEQQQNVEAQKRTITAAAALTN